jgi:DNA-binding transcriptional ArsR family regulator
VKDEDVDWRVYHLMQEQVEYTPCALAERAGLAEDIVRASLLRLENALLVSDRDGCYSVLSQSEMLIRCQARYDRYCPVVFENGVIKVRKEEE